MSRLICIAVCLFGCMPAHALTLAETGQARAAIVVGTEPTPAEETAAAELALYLRKITGAGFAVMPEGEGPKAKRLLVGPSQEARSILGGDTVDGLGPEEYIIRTVGEDLLLVGGRPRGSLYAVYSFLEDDLGCRFMTWYGDEHVPRQTDLRVPALNRRQAPATPMRDIVCHMNGNSDLQLMQRFLVRNRCQGPDLRFTGDLTAMGDTSHRWAFPPDGWLVHTLFQWVPPDKHFKAHPEWFSLVNGQRVATRHLCFSNDGLRAELTDAILRRVGDADPRGVYSVSAMDWEGAFCDCPDCRALVAREGTPGAPLFDYLAELGPQLKARFPEATVSTLAYRKDQSEIPPENIKLPDNVVIIFAPIHADFGAPMEHPSNADTLRNLANWTRATSHLWVWYYPNHYGQALPPGFLNRLAKDFRLFSRVGVEGYFVEQDASGVYDSRRMADLQTWLITKLMWDPERNLEAMVADFTDRHYGSAAPLVRQYVASMESAVDNLRTPLTWNAPEYQHQYLTPRLLLGCQRILDQAEQAVANDATALPRVQHLRMSLDLACILRWTQLSTAGEMPFTMRRLVTRYRETYADAARDRLLETRWSTLLAELDDQLKWYRQMTPLKPVPPPLDSVPIERVWQFTPETARLHGEPPPLAKDPAAAAGILVEDPKAAAGIAATLVPHRLTPPNYAPKDLPVNVLHMGFYDGVTGRQQHAYAGKETPLAEGGYRLYSVGRTALNPHSFVWFDWSWHVQFPDVSVLYDPGDPGKEWDIYASVRFEGPAYDPDSKAETSRLFVDRVILVEAAPQE